MSTNEQAGPATGRKRQTVFLLSGAQIIGGAERVLQEAALALQARGHTVVLVTQPGAPLGAWAEAHGLAQVDLAMETLRQRNPLRLLRLILRYRAAARRLVARFGPGVFYSHTRHAFMALAVLPRGLRKIAHHHEVALSALNRLLYARVTTNVFVSTYHAQVSGLPPNGRVLLNAGAATAPVPPVPPPGPEEPLRLAMFARFTRFKGHDLVLDAARDLQAAGVAFEIDIWGAPGDPTETARRDALRATAETTGLPVRFCGFHDDPGAVIRTYHALLSPSQNETFGLVPIEGFSRGVPVLAHGSGGALEIYHGRPEYALFLFHERSGAALTEAIQRLRDLQADPARYAATVTALTDDIQTRFDPARFRDAINALIDP